MTLREFINDCVTRLAPLYPAPEAKSIAFRLLEHFTDIPSYKYISEPDLVIDLTPASSSLRNNSQPTGPFPYTCPGVDKPAQAKASEAGDKSEGEDKSEEGAMLKALAELETGRPLQYVLGVTEFCGHRFKVGEGCLIPRPETEELVSCIIDDLYAGEDSDADEDDGPFSILDLCTGSGCIAWSLAAEFPEAMVYGCDLSEAALRYACRQRIKVRGAKPVFFSADVLAAPPAGLPKFDLIVSNPPYICDSERAAMRPNVLDFEPVEALFVPDDDPLRFYRAIARWADALLRPDGHLYLEINERFGPETAALFPGARVVQDLTGRDRFVIR